MRHFEFSVRLGQGDGWQQIFLTFATILAFGKAESSTAKILKTNSNYSFAKKGGQFSNQNIG